MVERVRERQREVPVVGRYDVLVCGAGTSGVPAAVSAARRGARVALLERYGFPGGVPATSIMPCWHGMKDHLSDLLREFAERVRGTGPGPDPLEDNHMEPEYVKQAAAEMLQEAGVELHLHTWVADTLTDGASVRGVVTESKSGRRAFLAEQTVDATGDGDVARHAGAEFIRGGEGGILQGMTLRFRIGGIDMARYFDWIAAHPALYQAGPQQLSRLRERALAGKSFFLSGDLTPLYEESDIIDLPRTSYFNCSSIRPGELSLNATRIDEVDGLVEEDLTRAELTCRRQVLAVWRFLRQEVAGFEEARLVETAPQIGVRESGCVVGDHVLTEEDCRSGRQFPDSVSRSHVTFDMHEKGWTCETVGTHVTMPYRSLLPRRLENLLVAGRAASADHVANSSMRRMYTVFGLGDAAGMAAAMAAEGGLTARGLPYEDLKKAMQAGGLLF